MLELEFNLKLIKFFLIFLIIKKKKKKKGKEKRKWCEDTFCECQAQSGFTRRCFINPLQIILNYSAWYITIIRSL